MNRIFREAIGLPVNAFLQKLRAEEACRLLSATDLAVVEVASACGFSDVKSFYAELKKYINMTPGEYRQKSRNN